MSEQCPKCQGAKCPFCLNTGKRLFEIGEMVLWDNQEGSLAPLEVRQEDYCKYVGNVYRVNALVSHPGDTKDRYYVGLDVEMENIYGGISSVLVFDTNLRRPLAHSPRKEKMEEAYAGRPTEGSSETAGQGAQLEQVGSMMTGSSPVPGSAERGEAQP